MRRTTTERQVAVKLREQPHPVQLAGGSYGPGRHHVRIPITTDLAGNDVTLHAHLIVGARPGPTLTLTSTLHGIEWLSIEMIRRTVLALDHEQMTGSVLALPVVNPPALGALSRLTPGDSDFPDLNRIFPGKGTWMAELIAKTVVREVLPHTSALIDYHLGIWGSTFGYVVHGTDFPDPETNAASEAMALAFDLPLLGRQRIIADRPGTGSLVGYAGARHGIPSCIAELGGAGFGVDTEDAWIDACVDGVLNVMRRFVMLPGEPPPPRRRLVFETKDRVNPSYGGLFFPSHPDEHFGREVKKGEVLGTVVSPYTFEVLEELKSPFDGYVAYYARWYPVQPGDWAFGIVPKDHPGTRWEVLPTS
jgi:predicted deacylase